jgi:hypothetical protein
MELGARCPETPTTISKRRIMEMDMISMNASFGGLIFALILLFQ